MKLQHNICGCKCVWPSNWEPCLQRSLQWLGQWERSRPRISAWPCPTKRINLHRTNPWHNLWPKKSQSWLPADTILVVTQGGAFQSTWQFWDAPRLRTGLQGQSAIQSDEKKTEQTGWKCFTLPKGPGQKKLHFNLNLSIKYSALLPFPAYACWLHFNFCQVVKFPSKSPPMWWCHHRPPDPTAEAIDESVGMETVPLMSEPAREVW